MSPEASTSSNPFPDRPIRPLPKRRLRERLSPEVAESIKYPPANQTTTPLFYYPPYSVKDDLAASEQLANTSSRTEGRRAGLVGDSDDDDDGRNKDFDYIQRSPPEILLRTGRLPLRSDGPRSSIPQPPLSAASSVDGYDSFENTNNKKKRKIPTAGDSTLNGGHISADGGSFIASSPTTASSELLGEKLAAAGGTRSTVAVTSGSQGLSGPGRGRYGRSRSNRSPLRALTDANSPSANRSRNRLGQWASSTGEPTSGIISSAIANAEKLPVPQGQENVSLLQQHSSTSKLSPISTQFTFTCDSQVLANAQWPGAEMTSNPGYYPHNYVSKPTPMGANQSKISPAATSAIAETSSDKATNNGVAQQPVGEKDEKKQLARALRRQEAQRRRNAEADRRKAPQRPEDEWICEFCEYERIFGKRPRALIQKFERKVHDEAKKREEIKARREKVKARNRKGKKGGKGSAKGAAHTHDSPASTGMHADNSQSTHEDSLNYDLGEAKPPIGGGPYRPGEAVNGHAHAPQAIPPDRLRPPPPPETLVTAH